MSLSHLGAAIKGICSLTSGFQICPGSLRGWKWNRGRGVGRGVAGFWSQSCCAHPLCHTVLHGSSFEKRIPQPEVQKLLSIPNSISSISCSSHSRDNETHSLPLKMPSTAFWTTYHHKNPNGSEQAVHIFGSY